MVFSFPELSLDLSPPASKSSFSDSLSEFLITDCRNSDDRIKLNQFIYGLEDELTKIQAFQRELPHSFSLLNHVIGKLKVKANKCEERRRQEGKFGESEGVRLGIGNDMVEKKDWMSCVQLWCPRDEEEESRRKPEVFKEEEKAPELTLVTPAVDGPGCGVIRPVVSVGHTGRQLARLVCHTAGKKQRRCWSTELHRRFVDALEMLGGSQVATPKQIRDLMQVDGLTNDEVKSHLQKYRLHIRKVPAGSTKTPSVDQGMSDDKLELGYSNSDIEHSRSPESPLDFAGSKKCNSYSMEDDDEDKADGHSWKAQQLM